MNERFVRRWVGVLLESDIPRRKMVADSVGNCLGRIRLVVEMRDIRSGPDILCGMSIDDLWLSGYGCGCGCVVGG
jgi:hypothetical protein